MIAKPQRRNTLLKTCSIQCNAGPLLFIPQTKRPTLTSAIPSRAVHALARAARRGRLFCVSGHHRGNELGGEPVVGQPLRRRPLDGELCAWVGGVRVLRRPDQPGQAEVGNLHNVVLTD